jgi:rare lipoprotein A
MFRSPWLEAVIATAVILLGCYAALVLTVPARGAEAVCGTASYYAHAHHGRTMATGRPFNMHAMTAAMWGPKFGTRYRVTSGGKSVVVTITDRGPAKRLNRIIDLSYAAAKQLGMIRAGTASVCLTKL